MEQTRAQASIERITKSWKEKPRWWHEVIYIGFFYGLYTLVRNVHGSVLSINTAKAHAADVVSGEKWMHIFTEHRIQQWALPHTWFIKFLDAWYGTAHFIVTIGVLLWLYHAKTERYRKWRNVIFGTTFFALVGYLVYPLAPPRLLPSHYGFVDTLATVGGLWDFNSKTVEDVSNQYAAMPSLHAGWATWCAVAMFPILRHWWTRVLMVLYPCITITAIVATANHYWFDVFGGWIAFGLGYTVATLIHRRRESFFYRRFEAARRAARHDESDHGIDENLKGTSRA